MYEKYKIRTSNYRTLLMYKEGVIDPNCKPGEFLESGFFKEDYPHSNVPKNALTTNSKRDLKPSITTPKN